MYHTPFTGEATNAKHSCNRQLHTTHVRAAGCEPHGSSPNLILTGKQGVAHWINEKKKEKRYIFLFSVFNVFNDIFLIVLLSLLLTMIQHMHACLEMKTLAVEQTQCIMGDVEVANGMSSHLCFHLCSLQSDIPLHLLGISPGNVTTSYQVSKTFQNL